MKIAIFANDDISSNLIFSPLFAVPGVEVVRLCFPASPRKGARSSLGAVLLLSDMASRYWLFLVLSNGLFKVFDWLTTVLRLSPGWAWLASLRRHAMLHGLTWTTIDNFNAASVAADLKLAETDLLIIRVGTVLKAELLNVPKLGTWCVHSSLMPSFRGIAGEFHALRTAAAPIGSTVFRVTPSLDEGPPLGQVAIKRREEASVFSHMIANNIAAGRLLARLVGALARGEPVNGSLLNANVASSYFSWPSRDQVQSLRSQGKSLMRLSEVMRMAAAVLRIGRFAVDRDLDDGAH